jgi:Flp pilus assembly protein TadD
LVLRGETERALPYLQAAVEANPAMVEPRRELGRALHRAGRSKEALEHLEYVARMRPGDEQVHALLGAVYRALGNEARARAELKIHKEILDRKAAAAREAFAERAK